MRKKLISILIANVLFLTNAGFTSLAVEQNIDESIAASSTEVTAEAAVEADEGESQEGDGSDLYFDDVEYVKIQSFTELPEKVKNQQLKQGGRLEELNFPESLEVSVVADLGRDDRIREQLGRERELMREAEREALEAEEKDKASAEDTEEEPEEEIEEEENEEGEGFSQIIDGEEIYFFGSDSEAATQQTSAESASENVDQTEDEPEETSSGEAGIVGASNANVSTNASTGASVVESATAENTNAAPEPAAQEQSSSTESTDTSSVETTETPAEEPAETPSDAGNEGSVEESTPSEDLVGRIISIFRPLMVHAAEVVQEPVEEKEEETAETAVEEEKEDAPENENASSTRDSTEENAGNSGDGEDADEGNPAETPADNEEDVEETEKEQVESIEIVSGIEWVLDPSRSDADPFSSEEIGKKFVFVPVLVIPDYYYIEAELPTITVDIVEDYFAFDKAVDVDGVKIRVRADEGVFPEGATLFAQKLQEEDEKKVQDKVEEQLEEATKIAKAYTFDIQIRDKDGNEIEPDTEKGRVFVSFEVEEVSNADYDAEIYHVIEDKNIDESSDTFAENENTNEAVVAEENGENAENTEESIATIENEFTVKKLEAELVDGVETSALEAETDGFSVYTLVFYSGDAGILKVSKSYLYLESETVKNVLGIDSSITSITIEADSGELIAKKLEHTDGIPTNIKGVYKESASGEWFLIVKKPFEEKTISITQTSSASPIIVTVKNENLAPAEIGNSGYPYATEMGADAFNLKVLPIKSSTDLENVYDANDVFYQWQYNSNNVDYGWTDIELANMNVFGASIGSDVVSPSTFKSNSWFRCLVNGVPSESIMVVTPSGDTTKNGTVWPATITGSSSLCYVSNGKVAYTVVPSQKAFDILSYDEDNEKMLQTTSDNKGWSIYSDMAASPSFDLDDIMFAFGQSSVNITADLKAGKTNFAISANCAIGSTSNGTLYAYRKDGAVLKASYMEASSLNSINSNNAATYKAFSITPITGVSRVWVGKQDPVPFSTNNDKYVQEGTPAALAMSWMGVEDGGVASFSVSAGTIDAIGAIGNTKTAEFIYDNSNKIKTNITGARLYGDELTEYAESEGGYTDTVKVDMYFEPIGSVESDVSTKFKSAAGGELTSYSSDTSNVTTTSKATTYIADFVEITVDETVEDEQEYKDELSKVITIELDYNIGNKQNFKVIRYHNNNAKAFTAYKSKPPKNAADERYYVDKSTGKVYIYTNKFSTYALAYEAYTVTFVDDSGKTLYTAMVNAGDKVKKPEDPSKDGYSFAGWTTTKVSSTSTSTTNVSYYDFNNSVNKNLTLYAHFKKLYTVTFDNGTSKSTVKVVSGEKVAKPSPDPTMDGYEFKGWYPKGSGGTSTSSTASNVSAYNFDTPVTKDLELQAGWKSLKASLDDSKAAAMADSDNESRAPKTGDDLPVVWLWVLLLVAGVTTFTVSAREIANAGKNPEQPKKKSKLQVYLLLAGIIIKTTFNFIVRKIRENKAKVLLGLSTAVILVSCIVLASTVLQYHKAESLYSDADVTYVETSEDEEVDEYVEEIKELAGEEPKFDWWDCAQVNLKELKAEYPEVVGWIYFENENISYPIMYSGDNAKYLKTAYTGEKAKAGAIFIDGESTPDFTDPHSLIYGHNMRDLSMFGRLRYYMTTPDYYQDHQYFQIFTEDKVYRYQIFAYEEVADNHDVFWVFGKEPTGYYKMLKEIEQGSYCNSGIITNESDHVITLATCTDKDNERLIVSAVRTDEYDYAQ